MLIKLSAQGFDDWQLEVEVAQDTTVAAFKQLLAAPPHSLEITSKTKVLWRRANNCLMALLDNEKVRANIVLLNAAPTVLNLPFPKGFLWGTATAAHQIEGAADQGGRTPSIWDTFAAVPGNIDNGDTATVACDHYNRFREDVKLMKELGFPAYRFSISWSRLLPSGRGAVNPKAVEFYRALLWELAQNRIQPLVTLYHWDLPQCLEDEYNGWLGREILDDFEEYAAACFSAFGDCVKLWVTINEPWCAAVLGYASGEHAPGRKGAPSEEPYLAAHHMILAHARAVKRYRSEFKSKQAGRIGIALNMDWKEPLTSSEADVAAQSRALAWQLGWFADPIYRGQYPSAMRTRCQGRLPTFTEAEQKLVKGSSDFFGLNHYSTDYVSPDHKQQPNGYFEDSEVKNTSDPNWAKTGIGWDIVPWGLQRLVLWIHREYAPPGGIIITENGCAVHGESVDAAQNDSRRVDYILQYLTQLHKAIIGGANVWGYFAWSFMDNFEWAFGYAKRFGLIHVDYETLERNPKASARLLAQAARDNVVRVPTNLAHGSEFTPMGAPKAAKAALQWPEAASKGGTAAATDGSAVSLSVANALHLLTELANRYQDPVFQRNMEAAYQQFEEDRSNLNLSRRRQALCLPIQSEVLPKYGFEASFAGVHKSVMMLRGPELSKDKEVQKLTSYNNFLISELPRLRVREEARRREREELGEVLEALGMVHGGGNPGNPGGVLPGLQVPGAGGPEAAVAALSVDTALRLLEEFAAGFQDEGIQEQLMAAWGECLRNGGDTQAVSATCWPVQANACVKCGLTPWRSFGCDTARWLPPELRTHPEVKGKLTMLEFLLNDLPIRRAKQELAEQQAMEELVPPR